MTVGSIEHERLWSAENVPREFFCPICSCLLWQPRSCGACQNLFCEACILKWLQVKQSCPYGCERYQDKRCSPQIRCLLSNVWIRCQSFQYGCTAVLSYDTLEEHQTKECSCPSTRCQYCENLMLVDVIKVHEQECGQRLGNCTKCDRFIPLFLLEKHQLACFSVNPQRNYLQINHQPQDLLQSIYTLTPTPARQDTTVPLISLFNVTLEERYTREQYYKLVWWLRLWRLIRFTLTNPLSVPHILITVWGTGYVYLLGYLLGWTFMIFARCFRNMYTGFLFIITLTAFLHSVVPWLFNSINDNSIMISCSILSIATGALFVYCNTHLLNNEVKLGNTLLQCIASILVWKLRLLLLRFYFHWIPAYVTATFISGISVFIFVITKLVTSPQLRT